MTFEETPGFLFESGSPAQWLSHTLAVTALLGVSFVVCRLVVASGDKVSPTSELPLPPGPSDKWFTPGPR